MRLLTRSDFDGLICAALLKEAGVLDDIRFIHPKDMQDGSVEVTADDILANVPYAPGCGLWFDHHSSEEERVGVNFEFQGAVRMAPSCARVIWDYYGGLETFPEEFDEMMAYVDKCDSANLTAQEIWDPRGWVLLGFMMDPRTGLGRYHDYRISNYDLMMKLVDWCRTMPGTKIVELPDVKERVDRYFEQDKLYRRMLRQRSEIRGEAIVLDLRDQDPIFTGNRFLVFAMFPKCNISITLAWVKEGDRIMIAVGHSIVNRSSRLDVGSTMLRYGGGGHRKVGTCQVPPRDADRVLKELLEEIAGAG